MYTWWKRWFMHSPGFIKLKIIFNSFIIIFFFEEINSLQYISLFNKATSKNSVPWPMLVNRSCFRIKIFCQNLLFIEKLLYILGYIYIICTLMNKKAQYIFSDRANTLYKQIQCPFGCTKLYFPESIHCFRPWASLTSLLKSINNMSRRHQRLGSL